MKFKLISFLDVQRSINFVDDLNYQNCTIFDNSSHILISANLSKDCSKYIFMNNKKTMSYDTIENDECTKIERNPEEFRTGRYIKV